ncbi:MULTISPECIES: nuclear transport factor 2 family protein [unclassified Pseudofrankia]|uniref:nuclear transport factor 2 family protein n=1 Tax=unclassified Pseudofrankia TaxID=2994372 RepID=UPI0008D9717A|nr:MULTISPECIES: nuclear transport factor 2 family protein [unclassified Pseudofrankia]MDT3445771.1 nuclear transport factor 2 family protein [Pseudofrankia sp. BMG5.37]OHV62779.1 gamma-BHC dehydrochlorinase [Pseudofrankia sp. BMG5.36]
MTTSRADIEATAVQQLLDKQAIREATLRYCRGVDRADPELISSAYHPDAVDEHGEARFTGETVGQGIADLASSARVSSNQLTNQLITLHGDGTAACETYYTVWRTVEVAGEEGVLVAAGRYLDRFERRAGEWRIAHRLVVVDLTHLLPPAGPALSSRPPLGRRDRTDPSYALLSP